MIIFPSMPELATLLDVNQIHNLPLNENFQAKADGFLPGGASLHSCMTPHGPDTKTYEATIANGNNVGPHRIKDTMAFMFESCLMPRICPWALESSSIDHDYYQCWIGLKSHFNEENTILQNGNDVLPSEV